MKTKKLIEVALPLEKINAESAREKSIRYGHPSTLHLWWARRPLAAARAVLWASLVDDPSSHPEKFPTETEQDLERQRLFGILEQLVVWENTNNEDVLRIARNEILKSTDGMLPALLDPFAGGGAIPLEAQRLGLKTFAQDLNPVAVMINKAMIEIPPRFSGNAPVSHDLKKGESISGENWAGSRGLAEDIRYYGTWLKNKAYEQLASLYPTIHDKHGEEYTVIAWIWARTVASPDPAAHGAYVPLVSSFKLASKRGNQSWAEIVLDEAAQDGWRFEVKTGDLTKAEETRAVLGTKSGKAQDFVCCLTNSPIKREYVQEEGKSGRLSKRLMAVVALGNRGRKYFSPSDVHESIGLAQEELDEVREARDTFLSGNTPTRAMVTGGVCSAYGLSTWGDLFTGRQIMALTTFSKLVSFVQRKAEEDAIEAGMTDDHLGLEAGGDGARAYGEAIGVYLCFAINKLVDRCSCLCGWDSGVKYETVRNVFSRQAISMSWDFAESNPFSSSSGCFDNCLEWVCRCVNMFRAEVPASVIQRDAQEACNLEHIMISTDPPYYDNIGYADLSDFFYVWMRKTLKGTYPELFRTVLVPKAEELVATPYRFGGDVNKAKTFFEEGMLNVCRQLAKCSADDIPVTIYYAYKQRTEKDSTIESTGWETMLSSIIKAGFTITGTWPIRTEMANRAVASGTNALASSVVLVCRKLPRNAPQTTRRNLVSLLRRELRPALKKLQDSNIAPVDLAQSAIGPGMAVFSRYSQVLEADGTAMTVRSALQIINDEIDLYFNEQVGDLDTSSRFCVDLYTQNAYNDMKYGEAEVLANAKGTSIPMMAAHGVLYAKAGNVHLIERGKLPTHIDPDESNIWLLTQQLTQAMATGGVESCASIAYSLFGSNAERAKDLAYRLYTIAEQKRWTEEAYAYNALVVSWPDIQSRAAAMKLENPEQIDLFDETNE